VRARTSTVPSLAVLLLAAGGPLASVAPAPASADGETPAVGQPIVALDEDEALSTRLLAALEARGPEHEPRTEHLFADGSPQFVNRLIDEDSPYLIQHAHNPVNWYPWGAEAFAAARAQDKPVFLSIGYATCHWCHVMERESFEDLAIADRMNGEFIAVKVDREQLPDIDAFYMTGVQLISGRGGWPMSSFLDADARPFFGATYFPPDDFTALLERVAVLWLDDRESLLAQGRQVSESIERSQALGSEARDVGEREIERAVDLALADIDALNGGFGAAPKFPSEPSLFFLLDRAARADDARALDAVDAALAAMAAGGIHDHVAGGFHRYAVDAAWQVPHFEKMLYNQAALARLYAEAWTLTGDEAHARIARRTLDYVLREMRSSEGLFHSATDADSEGEEGRFFVWTPEELVEVLGAEDAAIAEQVWNVSFEGNFEGRNILHTAGPLAEVARSLSLSEAELVARVDGWSDALLEARSERDAPLLDDKVLTAWNGMMITALVEGSERLDEPRWMTAAVEAADTLWDTMSRDDGAALWRARLGGRSSIDGTQLDHAFFAEGLIRLHDATGESRFLERATRLADSMIERFRDPLEGGFFMGASNVAGAPLAARPKDLFDNAMPSGNSVALGVLTALASRTGERRFGDEANALIAALSVPIAERSRAFPYLLVGVADHLEGEGGARVFAGRGAVRAEARVVVPESDDDADARVIVDIALADGWHINAHRPLQDYLVPTLLTGSDGVEIGAVDYPEPEVRTLAFQREPMALHEGRVTLSAPLAAMPEGRVSLPFALELQVCSDSICLAPESLSLRVPIATLMASAER